MLRKTFFAYFVIMLLIVFTLAGCKQAGVEETTAAETTAAETTVTEEITGEAWFTKAAEPYKGTTIKIISQSAPRGEIMASEYVPAFEQLTGIKVDLEIASDEVVLDKETKDMTSGTHIYDAVYLEQDYVDGFIEGGYLTNITKLFEEKPELLYPDFDLQDFIPVEYNSFCKEGTDELFAMPWEGSIKTYCYRKDLFEDPAVKDAFKKEVGWDLRPAQNPDEYAEIAKFFAKWGPAHNMEMWGSIVTAANHIATFYEMVETIFPLFGVCDWGINKSNWKATVENGGWLNGDDAKKALKYWVSMLQYAPPEAPASTWGEAIDSYAAGRAAQSFMYGCVIPWQSTDPERSQIVGKNAQAVVPATKQAWEKAKAGEGYIGYYDMSALGIPVGAKHPEATILFLQYINRKELMPDVAKRTGELIRLSTLDDPVIREFDDQVGGYFDVMLENAQYFAGAPRFPFHLAAREVMLPYFARAFAKEISPDQALDEMAIAVDKLLIDLGYAK